MPEKELLISDDFYRKVAEISSDITIVISIDETFLSAGKVGCIQYINKAGLKLLNASWDEVVGKPFFDFVHTDSYNDIKDLLEDTSKRKKRLFFEVNLLALDGSPVSVEISYSTLSFSGEKAILITGRDITKHKIKENELKLSEQRFKTLVQNINGYIYSVLYENGEPVSSYHSPQCIIVTGYTPEEYMADPELWIKMVHEEDKEKVYNLFVDITENLQQTHIEHRIIHKNGEIRWISNIFTVQLNDNDELVHIYGFIYDITDRKKAEEALQEQILFLQKLIDTIPNPIFYKNKEGKFQGCNIAFEKYIGKSREEIIGKYTEDIMQPEQARIHHDMDSILYENPGVQVYELKSELPGGIVHDVIINKAIYFEQDKSTGGLVGVISDITTLKKTQKDLAEALEMLKEMEVIINKGPAVVFLWLAEADLPVEFVSENVKQFGYAPEEFISGKKKYAQIIHPSDLSKFMLEIKYYSSGKFNEFTQEYRISNKFGDFCWVSSHAWVRRNKQGEITHFQGIVIDITNRKLAELQLRESEERYRTLAENSYDLICELSSKSRFLYISPNCEEILGYRSDELVDKSILEYVHLDDLPGVLSELKKDYGRVILRFKHKTEGWRWFESAGRKFKTATGERRGVIVSRDITERKRLEQQLIQTEKLMAVGEMSAMIAHEFRNALTSVKMILQLTGESENLTQAEKKSFNVAINSIYHMETVVQQLLNFALPTPKEFRQEDLNLALKECLPFIKMQAKKRSIIVYKRFDNSIPPVTINSSSIKEAVINLLLNSTQAFEADASTMFRKISLFTRKIRLHETIRDFSYSLYNENLGIRSKVKDMNEIILEKGTECALIEISDNGCGIDHAFISRIFEPFFTTKEKGSGLGLSIVKRTINSHGGVIKVESVKNSGTSFKIYLPLNN